MADDLIMKKYLTGFTLSIILTLAAFYFVQTHIASGHRIFSHEFLYIAIVVCAVLQLFVQLIFFFHFGRGSTRGWNITALAFAGIVVFIIVGGTLWIMYNLQANSMDNMFQNGIITPQNEDD